MASPPIFFQTVSQLLTTMANLRLLSVRNASRRDCAKIIQPRCSPEALQLKPPCETKRQRLKSGLELPKSTSIWENPECCIEYCKNVPLRYDELYYKSTNKLSREYPQTWVSGPQLITKEIPICCNEEYQLEPMEKRYKKRKIRAKCAVSANAMQCLNNTKITKCPNLSISACPGRRPPICHPSRKRSTCKREPNPYPSYSECLRDPPNPDDPIECKCNNYVSMCEVWEEFRRRIKL